MDISFRDSFLARWEKYFPGAEPPVAFFYAESPGDAEVRKPQTQHACIIGDLARVRAGRAMAFDECGAICGGAKRYLGFAPGLREGFEYFLSYGIPGKMDGERYKKTPEIVKELLAKMPKFDAPKPYIVFKRFDMLDAADSPDVVIFFATPDVMSGLFTLSGFDEAEAEAVIAPFAAGCGSIVQYPYRELANGTMRGVIGMFDVSARPCVPADRLTFAVPWPKFVRMAENMDESFLITNSWKLVRNRMENAARRA
ncbi:MAG: DUF169 domain-containing protein [bacterium]|jgi:uncharacterized protein (DUF169 family)